MQALAAILLFATAALTDSEAWNEGVDLFRRGDETNALRVLRPLMLSKTHGARAAELVAKLEYDRRNLEEAARAAQIALRAAPDDARLNRNFTRAIDDLPRQREERRIEAILKAAEGKGPGALLQAATANARALMTESGTYRTNVAARAVALSDELSRRAEKLAETWIPVRTTISQAVTNEEQASTILLQIDQAEAKTKKAARELADLDGDAYATMSDVEHDFTRFFKMTALPPAAMGEDLVSQSNAWQDVAICNGREWQRDALDWTRAFRARFPAWARVYEQQAQADTNKPPFTAEAQAKISALATELEKVQLECCDKNLPPSQERALGMIRQILELLPKDSGSSGSGEGQGQASGERKQEKNDPSDDKQQAGEEKQEPDSANEEQAAEEPEEDEKEQEAGGEEDEALESLLKKAQERNDEHEADKKARMRKAVLPPNERDW